MPGGIQWSELWLTAVPSGAARPGIAKENLKQNTERNNTFYIQPGRLKQQFQSQSSAHSLIENCRPSLYFLGKMPRSEVGSWKVSTESTLIMQQ